MFNDTGLAQAMVASRIENATKGNRGLIKELFKELALLQGYIKESNHNIIMLEKRIKELECKK